MESSVALPAVAGWRRIVEQWSLSRRFAVTGGVIAIAAAALAGAAISSIMARAAIEGTAASTALFMESFLAPAVQELANDAQTDAEIAHLDRLLTKQRFAARFPHVEIWMPDGRIVYSTSSKLIGQRFSPPEGLVAALGGQVAARYTDLGAREHVMRSFRNPFLEVYVPIRARSSENILAVAEIHEITGPLEAELRALRIRTWAAVIGSALLVMLALYGVVRHGSRQIESQRRALQTQLTETRRVSEQNRRLRERARQASLVVSQMNESTLRELGAELHDGPAQLIGLAALRVEHARRATTAKEREEHLREIESVLADANLKVRNLSKGLILPNIDDLPLSEVVSRAVRAHEQKTDTKVEVRCVESAPVVSKAVNACVYRFVQEGLNNAFRHAGGRGQRIECTHSDGTLSISVGEGCLKSPRPGAASSEGLGLTWIRARVESLGGAMQVYEDGTGLTIATSIPLERVD